MRRSSVGWVVGWVAVLAVRGSVKGAGTTSAVRLPVFTTAAPGVIRVDQAMLEEAKRHFGGFVIERFPMPEGDVVDLEVERFSVIGPDTRIVVGQSGGEDRPLAFDASRVTLLRGKVAGRPTSDVFLALADGMSRGHIELGNGRPRYEISSRAADLGGSGAGELLMSAAGSGGGFRPDVPLCGSEPAAAFIPWGAIEATPRGANSLGMKQIELAIETDFELFELFGDSDLTLMYLTELFGAVSHIYTRDVNAYYDVTFIRLWTTPTDPYDQPDPLSFFVDNWNATMGGVQRDTAQLVSGRRDLPYGGIAYLNALCSDFAYSVVGYLAGILPADPQAAFTGSYDIGVTAHELGHNCGSIHSHDYSPPIDDCFPLPATYTRGEIMSYCSQTVSGADYVTDLRFTARVQQVMRDFFDSVECLADDCNFNGVADATDIAQAASADANGNGRPDECEDCNVNGVLDPADISAGTSLDVDGSGIPDECEPDCNGNSAPDDLDIALGTSADVWENGVPDECEPDCDSDGNADYNELQANMPLDVNRNLVLDSCEDCDSDGTLDSVELAGAHSAWIASASLAVAGQYHSLTGVLMQNSDAVLTGGAHDVLVLPDGRVLVSQGGSNRVAAFNPIDGSYLGDFVASGPDAPSFPTGMTLGPDGHLYVSSRNNGRVLKYNGTSGAFIGIFVPAAPNGPVQPYGLTFGPNGNLFVTSNDGQVKEYNGTTGAFVRIFVTSADNGGLSSPRGLTFKADGNLLVASFGSDALLEYSGYSGAFVRVFNHGGNLYGPWGVRVSPNGRMCVTRDFVGRNHVTTTRIYAYDSRHGNLLRSYLVGDDTGLFAPRGFGFAPGWDRDCNVNATPDNCDIAGGFSLDADADGTPDECEVDCNGNGIPDRRDIIPFGSSFDCNWNGSPDECDLASGLGQDCNVNGRLDECDIAAGLLADANGNGVADGCVTAAVSRKTHAGVGALDAAVDVGGRVQNGDVSTEPRQSGVTELRIAFDGPPGGPGASPVSALAQSCGTCPCGTGSQVAYVPTGIAPSAASIEGNELVLSFAPGLVGPATYKLEINSTVAGFSGGWLEVRALLGDINGDRTTNGTDRSLVVAAWTGGGFVALRDLNLDGAVNATDRSVAVAQWTSAVNCAP